MKPETSFLDLQLQFIEKEKTVQVEEISQFIQTLKPNDFKGLAILNLVPGKIRTGLGGKYLIDFESSPGTCSTTQLYTHKFHTGDIVQIREYCSQKNKIYKKNNHSEEIILNALVFTVKDTKITLSLTKSDENIPNPSKKYWIVKFVNNYIFKRMFDTITRLKDMKDEEMTLLAKILLGHEKPSLPWRKDENESPISNFFLFDNTLNNEQKNAVEFALASKEIAVIHGPPGVTGKTSTLIEIIRQLVFRNKRLLVCGPSNISVDNIVERLSKYKIPLIRIGRPERLLPPILSHSLDIVIKSSDQGRIIQDLRKEINELLKKVSKAQYEERKAIYNEVKMLRKEYKEREKKCIDNIIKKSVVILATLHGAGEKYLYNEKFHVVIIDEASQALEAQSWIPLINAEKVILAGDHLQLPPIIKAKLDFDSKKLVSISFLERILKTHGNEIKRLLKVQYRMHKNICKFPSDELYESELVPDRSVEDRLLKDLDGVDDTDETREPLVFYNTEGTYMYENVHDSQSKNLFFESKSNQMEASLVNEYVVKLINAGVKQKDIAIITPYSAQAFLLLQVLGKDYSEIEINTVDGFQGREKEVVIFSLVRSNDKGEIGFLEDKRRLNVAITRPKRHLCIIGDSQTIERNGGFLKRWINYLEYNSDLRYPL
ncbi:hypothetical protein PORY_000120 [Pneumocystis oryctolagi]|uniref:Uncharacterized protein n=1 Tax=Pneumocystis oryctolagi TaxID=42067 RepID=A0ACB7CH96_9ASCO|nr:hypothetical protein PORY_000120 [Pneumocystis oryctolagi]